jgi:hypothetical protein
MTRSTFFVLVCIVALVVIGSLAIAANPPGGGSHGSGAEPDSNIETTLAVQRAVLQAKDHLLRNDSKKAVEVLEANLGKINGDRRYLLLLRDAYRAYVKDLTVANNGVLADTYEKRLKILEEQGDLAAKVGPSQPITPPAAPQVSAGVKSEAPQADKVAGVAAAPVAAAAGAAAKPAPQGDAAAVQAVAAAPAQTVLPAKQSITARGSGDPFDAANEIRGSGALAAPVAVTTLLTRGDEAFTRKQYGEAKQLYEQALQADAKAVGEDIRSRWAYCQLQLVINEVNNSGDRPCDWTRLEADVKAAATAAPHLSKFCDNLLAEMGKRKSAAPEGAKVAAPLPVAVKHLAKNTQGWQIAETANFRVYHKDSQEFAEKAAQMAEYTRSQMGRKWLGSNGEDWPQKCEIYLHATGADYSHETGQNPASPGHSRIELDEKNSRVVSRKIHLRCDNPNLLECVLPHETTHVVIAGQYGNKHVPRWVDEGVAVLTEPAEKVELHKKNLARSLQNRELIPLRDLMQLPDYPEPRQIGTFYAQSVMLVDYLTRLKGPTEFTQFVRDALREGYEPALRKHYGLQGFQELQDRWTERIVAEINGGQPAFAER